MSPPQSIDLKPIRHLHLENLLGEDSNGKILEDAAIKVVGHELVAQVFSGTDYYLSKDGYIEQMITDPDGSKQKVRRPLSAEAESIHFVKSGDSDHDENLTLEEVKSLLQKSGVTDLSAEDFFAAVAENIEERWSMMATNIAGVNISLTWLRTVHALETYNQGILIDDVNQSRMTFSVSSLTNNWRKPGVFSSG